MCLSFMPSVRSVPLEDVVQRVEVVVVQDLCGCAGFALCSSGGHRVVAVGTARGKDSLPQAVRLVLGQAGETAQAHAGRARRRCSLVQADQGRDGRRRTQVAHGRPPAAGRIPP